MKEAKIREILLSYQKKRDKAESELELRKNDVYSQIPEFKKLDEKTEQAKNKNDSRIRYLDRMIRTAKVIEVEKQEDAVGLFDTVVIFNEKLNKEMTIRIVTTLRQDALQGRISKESPVGKALMGRKAGERVLVKVSDQMEYWLTIRSIEKGEDDTSMDISSY